MTNDTPDWIRLHKALAVEAEHGFTDLVGNQYRFSEFLSLTFGKFPSALPPHERRRWQELSVQFASYPHLEIEARQSLIAEARRYLYEIAERTVSSTSTSRKISIQVIQSDLHQLWQK